MDVLLLLSKKKILLVIKGKGDYCKKIILVVSKLTAKSNKFSQKYIFTGWQIINKKILNNFTEKTFSLKKVYDLAEKKEDFMGLSIKVFFFILVILNHMV